MLPFPSHPHPHPPCRPTPSLFPTENSIKNFWNATYRSKAASKKRGMLWNYIAATRTTQDRQRAFINAAVQLATDGDFPPSILARLPPKPASASPQQWRDLFEAEATALNGSDDGEDTSCAPISTPTPTRPRMPSVRGPRGGASGLTPAMAAAALAVIKPSNSAASPVLSLSSPVVSRGSVMSRGSYEQSTTVEHERSSTSSDHGASEESAHHHGLQGMPMRSMHSHSYRFVALLFKQHVLSCTACFLPSLLFAAQEVHRVSFTRYS